MIKKILAGAMAFVMFMGFCGGVNVKGEEKLEVKPGQEIEREEGYVVGVVDKTGQYAYQNLDDKTVKLVNYCGESEHIVIPAEVNGYTVTVIGSSFMSGVDVDVKSIVFPDTVVKIESETFFTCDIEKITLGKNLSTIEPYAFTGCCIKEIVLSPENTAFKLVDGSLLTKDGTLFVLYPSGAAATTFTIPDGVECIGESSFASAYNLEEIIIPESVTSIEWLAFQGCLNLKRINLPTQIKIWDSIFDNCTSLESLRVPGNVETMWWGFYGCTNLKEVFLPSTLTRIENSFEGCVSLEDVYYVGTKEEWDALGIYSNDKEILSGVNIHYLGNVRDFVARMYTTALGRDCDLAGLNNWVYTVAAGENNGAGIVKGFFMSQEFVNRNLSDEEFVCTLYKTLFDREADEQGFNHWMKCLANGCSRESVIAGFVNSYEFMELCNLYGIERGIMYENGETVAVGITGFVGRLYEVVLGRTADPTGYVSWATGLVNGAIDTATVAASFFELQEYLNKNTSNEEFVTTMYRTFFDREPDSEGYSVWVNVLSSGVESRNSVINKFAQSLEWKNLLAEFGLSQ